MLRQCTDVFVLPWETFGKRLLLGGVHCDIAKNGVQSVADEQKTIKWIRQPSNISARYALGWQTKTSSYYLQTISTHRIHRNDGISIAIELEHCSQPVTKCDSFARHARGQQPEQLARTCFEQFLIFHVDLCAGCDNAADEACLKCVGAQLCCYKSVKKFDGNELCSVDIRIAFTSTWSPTGHVR